MADAFDSIGDFNAIVAPIVDTNALNGGLLADALPAVDSCLSELVISLAIAKDAGIKDSETKNFIIEALVTPFNEAANALSQTFIPDPDAFDGVEGFSDTVAEYTKQVIASVKNPIAAILAQQRAVFQQSLSQVGDTLVGGSDTGVPGQSGVADQVYDRVHFVLNELFMDSEDAGNNLGGLLFFAIEEALPAIDSELRYLKRMRKSIRTTVEETSRLPPSMVPQIPSLVAGVKLCNAEEHLNRVARDLRQRREWNRSEFSAATEAVCSSKDLMISGIVPFEERELLKTITGWDDRQLNAIQDFKFMPNVKFRLATIELTAVNSFMQEQDTKVIAFHRNLKGALDTLQSLASLNIGDVLALIIEVLRNQIAALRADLDAQADGFTGSLPRGMPDSVQSGDQTIQVVSNPPGSAPVDGLLRKNTKYATDVYAQLSSQLSAYAVLEGLCFVMQRTQRLYTGIQSLLDINSRFSQLLLSFTEYYKGEDCGPDTGAETINDRLETFLAAAEARLRGDTLNTQILSTRARDLEQAVRDHERFLICIRSRLFLGKSEIIEAAVGVTNVIKAVKNIMGLIQKLPELYEAIRTLDFLKMLGIEEVEYNALDSVMRALQCLVLQCDNQFLSSVARLAQRQFQGNLDNRKARNVTVGSLDELPKASRQSSLNGRIAAFARLIASIQRLTSFSIDELCNIDTDGQPVGEVPDTPISESDLSTATIDTSLQRSQQEEAELQAVAGETAAFGQSVAT